MIRTVLTAAALAMVATPSIANDEAADAAEAQAAKYSVDTTLIGDLLDNPELRALFAKHLPEVAEGEQLEMARQMTLRDVQMYAPDIVTDEKLAALDADLQKVN